MYTIIDYIYFYKDRSLSEVKWNTADNLICSILCYLPCNSFEGKKSLKDLYEATLNYEPEHNSITMTFKAVEVLKEIIDCKRYKNMTVSRFECIRNNETQFGAMTFRIDDITVVAYEGTDSSLIGWIENARLFYSYPTYTQTLAAEYLKKTLKFWGDNRVYVVGHSKGGNLAMAAAMECSNGIFNKIKSVINFDGPGFRYEQFISDKYKRMSQKLINIIPTGSMVGALLENEDYMVIKSYEKGWSQHYTTTWLMFGDNFIPSKASLLSEELHKSTTVNVRNLDRAVLEETFETLFKKLGDDYARDFKIRAEDLFNMYRGLQHTDPKIRKNIEMILDALLKSFR